MSDVADVSAVVRAGAVATSGRSEIVWVSGNDVVPFLDGLLSQNIEALAAGATAPSLLLSPNGKLRATLLVLRGADRVGLVCDKGRGDAVASDLHRFKIRVDVSIEVEERTIYEVWGATAAQVVADVPEAGRWAAEPTRFRMPFRHSDVERIVVVGDMPATTDVPAALLEPFRIEIGEAVMGVDLTEKTIPQEGADVKASVDFTKGCYLGQELVARIDSRGHVNRRLAGLITPAVVEAGAEVSSEGTVVGTVTSAAWSEAHNRGIALAMIRVEIDPGTDVVVAGVSGTVSDLPMSW